MTNQNEASREAFETAALSLGYSQRDLEFKLPDGEAYFIRDIHKLWQGWQARDAEVAALDELTDRQSEHISDLAHELAKLRADNARLRDEVVAQQALLKQRDELISEICAVTRLGSAMTKRIALAVSKRSSQEALTEYRQKVIAECIEAAKAVRKRLSETYQTNIEARCSPMSGNLDWIRLEGAVSVVEALQRALNTNATKQTGSGTTEEEGRIYFPY